MPCVVIMLFLDILGRTRQRICEVGKVMKRIGQTLWEVWEGYGLYKMHLCAPKASTTTTTLWFHSELLSKLTNDVLFMMYLFPH